MLLLVLLLIIIICLIMGKVAAYFSDCKVLVVTAHESAMQCYFTCPYTRERYSQIATAAICNTAIMIWQYHHHSGLVGDVAVPVSARQVVMSCAFLNPDARPRLNGRRTLLFRVE